MSRQFVWQPSPTRTAWHYTHQGYAWGTVAAITNTTFSVFVRQEFLEPVRWVAHIDNFDEAKHLVQTLVGASNV